MVENLENEIWKNILEYPGYMVSNMGRVMHLKGKGCKYDKILKAGKNGVGYMMVALNGKSWAVHLLVAKAFLYDTYQNGYEVHHINGNKEDNRVENLQYTSHLNNCRENRPKPIWLKDVLDKPVRCIETGEIYNSITEAARAVNISLSALSLHLKGKTTKCARLHWEKISKE